MNQEVHHYHPSSLLYTHSTVLNVPAGYNTPLTPQCSTIASLPNYDHETQDLKIDLEKDEWIVINKHKPVDAYHKQTKLKKTFDDESLIDNDHTIKLPPPYSVWQGDDWNQQIDLLRVDKRSQINLWRDAQEANTQQKVIVNSIEWDAGPSDRIRIQSTLAGDFIPQFWTDANDIDQPINRDNLKAIHTAIVQRGFEIHARQREMKCEIETITDFPTLEAYQVDWPQV